MAYCVKCGVELAGSEEKCPLCQTTVYHPDLINTKTKNEKKTYPPFEINPEESVSRSGIMFILSLVFTLPVVLSLLCNYELNGVISWSGYVVGALTVGYVIVVLPLWFKNPNPVIFVSADFVAVALYLFLINVITGGKWFLGFALPVTVVAMIITVTVIALVHYVKRGLLYIFGGAAIANGFYSVIIELHLNNTFGLQKTFTWSLYPLTAFFLVGMGLIIIAICKPIRESLHRKFFI